MGFYTSIRIALQSPNDFQYWGDFSIDINNLDVFLGTYSSAITHQLDVEGGSISVEEVKELLTPLAKKYGITFSVDYQCEYHEENEYFFVGGGEKGF